MHILVALTLVVLLPNPYSVCQSIATSTISMDLDYGKMHDTVYGAGVSRLRVDGREVLASTDGMFTSVKVNGKTYSSMRLRSKPVKIETADRLTLKEITYGDSDLLITETWTLSLTCIQGTFFSIDGMRKIKIGVRACTPCHANLISSYGRIS